MGTLCGGVDFLSTPSGVCSCGARRIVRRDRVWEMFRASERDLLLATVPKVGKSTGRNLRFLHFRTRYSACRSRGVYHAFAGEFPFRFVKRIVSAPAPLPLADAEKKSLRLSGSGVSLQVNSLVPSSEGGFGAVRLPIRRTESSAPTEGLLSFYRSLGGPMWASPPTKGLSCHWRSAGGGVRAPSKWLSNPCVSRTLNRRGCRQGRRISADPSARCSRRAYSRSPSSGRRCCRPARRGWWHYHCCYPCRARRYS